VDLFELEVCLKWAADSTSAKRACSTCSSQIGFYHFILLEATARSLFVPQDSLYRVEKLLVFFVAQNLDCFIDICPNARHFNEQFLSKKFTTNLLTLILSVP